MVTITGAGTIYLTASQAATTNYTSATATTTVTVNPATPTLSFTAIGTKVYGTPPAGDGTFTASASSASSGAITYSVTGGPASINASTGLVTLSGTGTVSLHASQAASGNYAAASADTIFQVNSALSITTSSMSTGAVGAAYSQQLQAAGGFGTYGWTTDTAGTNNLAAVGLTLSLTGLVSGTTPIAGGPESFTVTLSDGNGHTATATLSVTVSTITITTATLPLTYTGASYSQQLSSSGGAGGNLWSVSGANNLATYGLSLSSSGLLSGAIPSNAPTGINVVTFTAQVKDSNNVPATRPLTITVYSPLSLPTAGALHSAITGTDYSVNNVFINASGGSGVYSFAVNSTAIPTTNTSTIIAAAGNFTGTNGGGNTLLIGGTPPSSGNFTLNVTVTDKGVTAVVLAYEIGLVKPGTGSAPPPP